MSSQNILILGYGVEGVSTLAWLKSDYCLEEYLNATLTIADSKKITDLPDDVTDLTGKEFPDFSTYDVIVKSPGISPFTQKFKRFLSAGGKLTSNTALFFEFLNLLEEKSRPVTIGVTGTKGKSTTVAALEAVLKTGSQPIIVGGNQAQPLLDIIPQLGESSQQPIILMELSSHQLYGLNYSPGIAVILGIHQDHLDYYPTFQEYLQAKSNIARHQTENDSCYFFSPDETATQVAELSNASKIPFGSPQDSTYQTAQGLFLDGTLVIPAAKLKLRGSHNRVNLLPAVLISQKFGLSPTPITQLDPLPHRLEYIHTESGTFINDSLSTTPETALAALETVTAELQPHQKITLILGGHERHQDFADLVEKLDEFPLEKVYLLPQTGNRIAEMLAQKDHSFTIQTVENLDAVFEDLKTSLTQAKIVLLSPASASYNQFRDYSERGERFRDLANTLITAKT